MRLLASLSLLTLLAACAPTDAGDDPVVRPPEVVSTEQPDPTPTARETEPSAGAAVTEPDDASWEPRTDAPLALSEVAAAPFAGAIWTAGGFDPLGTAVDAVLVYDPTFDGWEQGPSLPRAVHHAALVSTGDALVLVGGYVGSTFDEPTAAVAILDAATGEWADGPALPEPRAAGAAAWDGTRIVYGGGVGPDGLAGDVWALSDGTWLTLGTLGDPREHLAAASDGAGRVWFLGGRTGGFDTNLATVDLAAGDEVARLGVLPTARGGVAGFHLPEIGACMVGGEGTERTFGDVECIDAVGAETVLPPLQTARHGLGAVVLEGAAYAVLGGPEPGLFASPVLEALSLSG